MAWRARSSTIEKVALCKVAVRIAPHTFPVKRVAGVALHHSVERARVLARPSFLTEGVDGGHGVGVIGHFGLHLGRTIPKVGVVVVDGEGEGGGCFTLAKWRGLRGAAWRIEGRVRAVGAQLAFGRRADSVSAGGWGCFPGRRDGGHRERRNAPGMAAVNARSG